jgi:hypothetical protein
MGNTYNPEAGSLSDPLNNYFENKCPENDRFVGQL